ncbi:hypothetical protein K458DRAFT_408767 [Lentithecium fluviatile CBS 122367]|uniref:Zn(2)-C6 fungal-type domain-containing protein n=1 Tax=Lentithecium fluviatile CBS 122367 TaxID=1168545 RepID=A0A6G1IKI6_9PLEO|nr:hypothetical protein K458DRAFT_408767 [Lentithecium fluviatile CBS 122367]
MPSATQDVNARAAVGCASEMSLAHNVLIRGLNSPKLKKFTSNPDIMAENVKQHDAFLSDLNDFEHYIENSTSENYHWEEAKAKLDTFTPALMEHLRDEIETILSLKEYDSARLLAVWKVTEDAAKGDIRLPGMFDIILPMVLGCADKTFDGGENFPPFPFFVPYLIDYCLVISQLLISSFTRHPASSQIYSMAGKRDPDCCWTCRLRRKKCDKARPACGTCRALSITCHRNAGRPDWMDKGREQRRMAEVINGQIRRNAVHQKERDAGSVGVYGGLSFVVEPESAVDSHQPPHNAGHGNKSSLSMSESVARSSSLDPTIWQSVSPTDDLAAREHFETAFLAKYLDDVHPFLFPFYRPTMLETGRCWISSLLKSSDVARHAALSLTAYFLTVSLQEIYPGEHAPCKQEIWDRLSQQTDGYFVRIQEEVAQLQLHAGGATTLSRVRSMESILQALLFEVILGRSGTWSIHLTAALELFDEIRHHQTQDESEPTFLLLLNGLGKLAWYTPERNTYIWNTEQAGFRFFTALLIFLDVISSTATEQRPHLIDHYPLLLADVDQGQQPQEGIQLRLSGYIGCPNWVLIAIAETVTLAKWKKDAKLRGALSVMELAGRARCIEKSLEKGILSFERAGSDSIHAKTKWSHICYGRAPPPVSSTTATKIWAQAAQIYLSVVVSGWQPCSPSIRAGVRKTLALLQIVHSPSYLHTFTWPFVVAGCLAQPGGEQSQFMAILDAHKEMGMYGLMREAREILTKTWESQGTLDRDSWDFASCFRILRFPALLI